MKTQSLKSTIVRLVLSGLLGSTVFAGPGPKGVPAEVHPQTQVIQRVVRTGTVTAKATASDFKTMKTTTHNPTSTHLVYSVPQK